MREVDWKTTVALVALAWVSVSALAAFIYTLVALKLDDLHRQMDEEEEW